MRSPLGTTGAPVTATRRGARACARFVAPSPNEASLGPPRWVAGCRRSVLLISTRQAVRRCPHPPAAAPRNWPLGIGRQATRMSVVTTTVTVNEVLGGQVALDLECLDRV